MAFLKGVVRGAGDIGSAVAHRLFREGCAGVLQEGPKPTTTRRGMAFADAVFDGRRHLDGVDAAAVRGRTDRIYDPSRAVERRTAWPDP